MTRYFIELAYKGTKYHGWQIQDNAISVQEILNNKLSLLLKNPIETTGCGRTDTGVHASQFFAHFDFENEMLNELELAYKLNAMIPNDIKIIKIFQVHSNAHARFDALSRSYSYYIVTEKEIFQTENAWLYPKRLNINLMNEAAALLLMHDDFGCFAKAGGQQHTNICTITEAKFNLINQYLRFQITANRFLRGMVRSIVGTLLEVGKDQLSINEFLEILKSKNRTLAGQTVPAHGLFLEQIKYPYLVSQPMSPLNL